MSNSTRPHAGPRSTTSVLVSGAGIAGTALAHWLDRYGFRVTVVERAPSLRGGGQAVDIRGTALTVVERMGLLDEVRARRTGLRGMSVVDSDGRELRSTTGWTASGGPVGGPDVEILRDDLAELIAGAGRGSTGTGTIGTGTGTGTGTAGGPGVEYLFDDAIETLVQHRDGVQVRLRSGTERSFDLVVGADGLHSNTRRLVFGPEADYLHPIGTYTAGWSAPNHLGLDRWEVAHQVGDDPNWFCMVMTVRDNSELRVFVGFHSDEPIDRMLPRDPGRQRELVAERSAHARWELPRFLRAMRESDAFHYDVVAQIRMESWSKDRVVLLGDAGYCCSPATGQGTSVALTAAYVLAGELHAAGGDHRTAFPAYERRLRDHVDANQAILKLTGDRKARSETVMNLGQADPVLEAAYQAALDFDLPDY
ncbi:FAD-dependent monooxygenase [Streptomyces sp. CBMA156]|uniref:FAD-dependent monooxygenase n=1 Tax=Streptomyces sp. CBMA156 TaxID=1930280 RepID=UPI001661BE3A|nr:FAD-dependent monooxygenase [Streptomyces sp. CBMA156]MBD0674222.1 FAD-dependent oxidoreductase [Streptomyces sp. CBMA156]MBD0674557.1 FAD-dependent oxidoreductase [Streptomyces sp. CBMA156]